MSRLNPISKLGECEIVPTAWGEMNWKITDHSFPGVEMTFGTCRINPGQRKGLHPNCEEILYVVSGSCEHKLGDAMHQFGPGDAICIPRNVDIGPGASGPSRSWPDILLVR